MSRKNKLVFKQDKIFWTSDNHFYHKGVIEFCQRPFQSLEEMNETMIINWNNVVSEDSTVIICGDFIFSANIELIKDLLSKLNGNKILILGNHCLQNRLDRDIIRKLFNDQVYHQLEIEVEDVDGANGTQYIFNSHYPCVVWPKSHSGSWHCFGHVHTNGNNTGSESLLMIEYSKLCLKSHDAGVDNNGFTPIGYPKLKKIVNGNRNN